jgi:hypothetical protein
MECKQKNTNMEQKRSKIAFPFKKIEKLIGLANKHNLQFLEVDGIKIIPTKQSTLPAFTGKNGEVAKDKWDELSPRQKEDYILFGPDGFDKTTQ